MRFILFSILLVLPLFSGDRGLESFHQAKPVYEELPCYEEYLRATTKASITVDTCTSTADSYESARLCVIRFQVSLLIADMNFRQCLRSTYQIADYP
jgi:hypothetical protein